MFFLNTSKKFHSGILLSDCSKFISPLIVLRMIEIYCKKLASFLNKVLLLFLNHENLLNTKIMKKSTHKGRHKFRSADAHEPDDVEHVDFVV